jgi:hypothetical protein
MIIPQLFMNVLVFVMAAAPPPVCDFIFGEEDTDGYILTRYVLSERNPPAESWASEVKRYKPCGYVVQDAWMCRMNNGSVELRMIFTHKERAQVW